MKMISPSLVIVPPAILFSSILSPHSYLSGFGFHLPSFYKKIIKLICEQKVQPVVYADLEEDLVNGPPVIDLGEQTMMQNISMQPTFSTHYGGAPYLGMYHNPYQAAYMSHLGQLPFLAQQAFSSTPKFV